MRSRHIIITLFLLGLLVSTNIGQAEAGAKREQDTQADILLTKINEVRVNPRLALERLDISEAKAVEVLGEDAWILDRGLPPLLLNEKLQTAAIRHGQDMIANGYYSHHSLSGLTPADRIAAAGYLADNVGETLAALDFDYYIDPETSLNSLLDNMLRDELNGVPGVSRNIFSPNFSTVGVAYLAGSGFLSTRPYAYLLVVDFCLPDALSRKAGLTDQAYLMWQKINEARANPRLALDRLAITEEQAVAALGSDSWVLEQGLPPLAWNDELQSAAQNHNNDMFANVYYDHVSSNGLDPESRIAEGGYDAFETGETMALSLAYSYVDVNSVVNILVDDMLRAELTGAAGVERNIFSPAFTEVGLGFRVERVAVLIGGPYAYVVVADFAAPVQERWFVVGQIDTGYSLALRKADMDMGWEDVEIMPGGFFQFRHLLGGEDLLYWRINDPDFVYSRSTDMMDMWQNISVDLRFEHISN